MRHLNTPVKWRRGISRWGIAAIITAMLLTIPAMVQRERTSCKKDEDT